MKEGFLKSCVQGKKLGEGGNGSVYELDNHGEKEAMKVIEVEVDDSMDMNEELILLGLKKENNLDKLLEDVMNEIRILYSLRGESHIVNYYNHIIQKQNNKYTIYLEMEYLHSLKDYYGDEMNKEQTLKLLYDILDALTICENNNIVHGDIKPDNIMVSQDGNNKLTDFGIAKKYDSQIKVRASSRLYASPEVIEKKEYTKQSDLYSLGLVIYQLFNNNRLPFYKEETTIDELIEKRMDEDIEQVEHLDKELNDFLKKCLDRKPENRYENASNMKEELMRLDRENHIPEMIVSLVGLNSIIIKLTTTDVLGKTASDVIVNTVKETTKTVSKKAVEHSGKKVVASGLAGVIKGNTIAKGIIAGAIVIAGVGGTTVYKNKDNITGYVDTTILGKEIELDHTKEELEKGDTLQIAATGVSNVKWSSKDTTIATVSEDGKVTAQKAGTTTIEASAGNQTKECSITVKEDVTDQLKDDQNLNNIVTTVDDYITYLVFERYGEQHEESYEEVSFTNDQIVFMTCMSLGENNIDLTVQNINKYAKNLFGKDLNYGTDEFPRNEELEIQGDWGEFSLEYQINKIETNDNKNYDINIKATGIFYDVDETENVDLADIKLTASKNDNSELGYIIKECSYQCLYQDEETIVNTEGQEIVVNNADEALQLVKDFENENYTEMEKSDEFATPEYDEQKGYYKIFTYNVHEINTDEVHDAGHTTMYIYYVYPSGTIVEGHTMEILKQ
jgi:serine/threonine protein kinase